MLQNMSNAWFSISPVKNKPKFRLFCFPYAGGSARAFGTWSKLLPDWIQVMALTMPGRDSRINEPLITDMSDLLDVLELAIQPYLDIPYAFFGHSMGGLMSYELAMRLRHRNCLRPSRLFLAGRSAPGTKNEERILHILPEQEFIKELRELNGIPTELLEHRQLLELVIPIIRADFQAIETWKDTSQGRADCPVTAFGGIDDKHVTPEKLYLWKSHTTASFDMQMFPGDHFFIRSAEVDLIARINYECEKMVRVNENSYNELRYYS